MLRIRKGIGRRLIRWVGAVTEKEGQTGRRGRVGRKPAVEGLEGRVCLSTGKVSVVVGGLDSPRGLAFGRNGTIFVALAGSGGTTSTVGQTQQVPPPLGPYHGGPSATVVQVTRDGTVRTIASGLPSTETAQRNPSFQGVAALAVLRGRLYALTAGGGASHGNPQTPNELVRINRNGTTTPVVDLSAYLQTHPAAHPEPDDFEPDGTWYSLVAARGALFAVEPNHGEVVRIDPTRAAVSRVVDVSATQGHIVPTALAARGSRLLVGNLGVFDLGQHQGKEAIFQIGRGGRLTPVATGLTSILGVAFDRRGRLYALESFTGSDFPSPHTGEVVRINRDGSQTVIADGLNFAGALATGPDGNLYVSNNSYGSPAGAHTGQVLRINLSGT